MVGWVAGTVVQVIPEGGVATLAVRVAAAKVVEETAGLVGVAAGAMRVAEVESKVVPAGTEVMVVASEDL